MLPFTKAIRDGVLADLPNIRLYCKKHHIYKPHIYNAMQAILDPETPYTMDELELDVLLEHDQVFFNDFFKDDVNIFKAMEHINRKTRHEWYTRLPSWLAAEEMQIAASRHYRETVVYDPKTPYFTLSDVPTYTDVVSVVKPKNFTMTPIDTMVGTTEVMIFLAPTLKKDDVRNVIATVIDLRSAGKGSKGMRDLSVSLPEGLLEFVVEGDLPENINTLMHIASIACSPTPFSKVMQLLFHRAVDADNIPETARHMLESKAMDLDIDYDVMRRSSRTSILNSRQMMKLINQQLALLGTKKIKKVTAKDLFYKDYTLFNSIRYFPDEKEAIRRFITGTTYFEDREIVEAA